MGYYIDVMGTISYYSTDEQDIVKAIKDLNYRHDLKMGHRSPSKETDDPFDVSWFSWLPPRYHEDETINSVPAILDMLGFEIISTAEDDRYGTVSHYVIYNNKAGAEAVFLAAMSKWVWLELTVSGEDPLDLRKWTSLKGEPAFYESYGQISYSNASILTLDMAALI